LQNAAIGQPGSIHRAAIERNRIKGICSSSISPLQGAAGPALISCENKYYSAKNNQVFTKEIDQKESAKP
jgi:hypothetical protein